MPLQGSGLIWMSQIRDEFRPGQAVTDFYSYYRNHGIITGNPEMPIGFRGSDPIWFSNFHGAYRSYGGAWGSGKPGIL